MEFTFENYGDMYRFRQMYQHAYEIAYGLLGGSDNLVSCRLPEELRESLVDELDCGRIQIVGKFDDKSVDFMYDELVSARNAVNTSRYRIAESVLYSKEFSVCIVSCQTFSFGGYGGQVHYLVFGRSKQSVDDFVNNIVSNKFNKYLDSILMMTDSVDGMDYDYQPRDLNVSLGDVFLDNEVKDEILRSIEVFFGKGSDFYSKYGVPYKRGILLYGKPGNGKTTFVKAISNMIHNPTVYWQVNEYTTSRSIKRVFDKVKTLVPAMLVIEDIDSLPNSCRSTFLNYLDGTYDCNGIFLIGTTNFPEKIDPALMNRAGRFDRTYEIKLPSEPVREQYLRKKGLGEFVSDDDVRLAARLMDGFSMSMLNELYNLCALSHFYDGEVNMRKIVEKLKETHVKQQKDKWFDAEKSVGFIS